MEANSYAEGLATATGVRGVGVVELEPASYERVAIVQAHPEEIKQRLGVTDHLQPTTVDFDHRVLLHYVALCLKVHVVAHTRASARPDADAQQQRFVLALVLQLLEVLQRSVCHTDGGRGCGHSS